MLRIAAAIALVAAVLAPTASAAVPERLPDDATIASIGVGGLGPIEAKRTVKDALAPLYENRPVAVRVNHKDTLVMPSEAGFVIFYDWMVDRAFRLAGAHKLAVVALKLGVKNKERDAAIAKVAKK